MFLRAVPVVHIAQHIIGVRLICRKRAACWCAGILPLRQAHPALMLKLIVSFTSVATVVSMINAIVFTIIMIIVLRHRWCWLLAGVSCSFAAPIGGLLLSIEEGASFYSTSLFWRGFLATCTGVCTLHFLAQFHEKPSEILDARFGIRRDLGLYDDNIALYGARFWYYIWELPIYVLIGCIAGSLGGWFIKLNIIFTAFRAKYIPASNRWRRFGEVRPARAVTVCKSPPHLTNL